MAAAAVAMAAVLLISIGATGGFERNTPASFVESSTDPSTDVPDTRPAPTSIPADLLLGVDEAWLIDRGDRTYDWGVLVRTPAGAPPRSGVDVDVRLIDAADEIVSTTSITLDGVGTTFPGVAAGRFDAGRSSPVRLEFDLVVGVPSDAPSLGERLDLRALDRSDDRISGRIRTTASEAMSGFGALFVWRDEVGDVVAAIPLDVERVRPGIDARFELDLDGEPVPDGLPDDVFWTA